MSSSDPLPLTDQEFDGLQDAWAARLLSTLGAQVPATQRQGSDDPVSAWAASGAMAVSGPPTGPPIVAPGQPAIAAKGAVAALFALARRGGEQLPLVDALGSLDGGALLAERAAIFGYAANAPWNLGGTSRAVRSLDGWVAVNLARSDDLDLVAALLQLDRAPADAPGAWAALDRDAGRMSGQELSSRSELIGLSLGVLGDSRRNQVLAPWRVRSRPQSAARPSSAQDGVVRVVDLSTLWAGPLCGSLLGLLGAEVIRVESATRPDGARRGEPAFDDLMHGGQPSVALDFMTSAGRAALRDLVGSADVVITSARSRALRGLGLDPSGPAGRDQVWVAVTAYGLDDNRVGFGDDCAMAGGLVGWLADGTPAPVGDALADPLTGLHAAVAALAGLVAGGSWLVDIALADVASAVSGPPAVAHVARSSDSDGWCADSPSGRTRVAAPRARSAGPSARPLGADTEAILAQLRS